MSNIYNKRGKRKLVNYETCSFIDLKKICKACDIKVCRTKKAILVAKLKNIFPNQSMLPLSKKGIKAVN